MDVSLTDIASRLRAADGALLVAHVNPMPMRWAHRWPWPSPLEALGVDARVSFPTIPSGAAGVAVPAPPGPHRGPEQAIPADLVMSMDASSGDRIGRLLAVGKCPGLHRGGPPRGFRAVRPYGPADATRPAAGLLALEIIDALGVDLTPDMALCL